MLIKDYVAAEEVAKRAWLDTCWELDTAASPDIIEACKARKAEASKKWHEAKRATRAARYEREARLDAKAEVKFAANQKKLAAEKAVAFPARSKIIKALGALGRGNDHEVLIAARSLDKLVRQSNLSGSKLIVEVVPGQEPTWPGI